MKRVLHHMPRWAVIPLSVLGAGLVLVCAHFALDHGTPPVARQRPTAPLDGPSQQLLPRMERETAVSATASDCPIPHQMVGSRQCLASSDALSVLAPVDTNAGVNAGWHSMLSTGTIETRPVALVSTHGYVPQPRLAMPSPRYGSNRARWDEATIAASAEEVQEPAVPTSGGMLDSLFAPPALSSVSTPVDPLPSNASHAPSARQTLTPLPPLLQPLPAVNAGKAESVAWNKETTKPIVLLPPANSTQPNDVEITEVEDPRPLNNAVPQTLEGRFVPLPPVDSIPVESVVTNDEPTLLPLPPVEPKLLDPRDSLALALFEGLFQPVAAQPKIRRQEQTNTAIEAVEKPSDTPEVDEMKLAIENEIPQPLPPVVRDSDVEAIEPSSQRDESLTSGQYERSWELELIAQEADKHSRRGFALANKQAFFSSRLEFTRALRIVAQGLDTEHQTARHSQALAAGLRALTEAEDFMPKDGHLEAELDLEAIAGAHRTPILHEGNLYEWTPLAATQKYHAFAQEKLAEAVGSEIAGSMALCGLGKLHMVIGSQRRGDGIASAHTKAMVLLQAALIASPTNHIAANELGILLAKNGRHQEARRAFQRSVDACPTAEGWRNLALTCETLGEMDTAYHAAQETLALRAKAEGKASITRSPRGTIRWVAPGELANTRGNVRTASTASPNKHQ